MTDLLRSRPTLTDLTASSHVDKWASGFQIFSGAIKSNTINIKKLKLFVMRHNETFLLLDALKTNTTLESLSIHVQITRYRTFPIKEFKSLGSKLIVSPNLKRFQIEADREEYFEFIAEGLQHNSTLEELIVKNSDLGENGLDLIAKILSSDQIQLKSLQLIDSKLKTDATKFCDAIKKITTLEELHIAFTHGDKYTDQLPVARIHQIFEAVSENNSITKFDWDYREKSITQPMIDTIQKRKFSHLTLSSELGKADNVTVPMIINALNYNGLVSLEISGELFSKPEEMQAFSQFISESKSLKNLVAKDQSQPIILRGLINNTSITDLDVSRMNNVKFKLLGELISTNKSITKLNISTIDIKSDEDFKTLFNALKFNRSITDLICQQLLPENADIIALFDIISDALKVNDTIIYLDAYRWFNLGKPPTNKQSEQQILKKYRELFSVNKSLRRLEFDRITSASLLERRMTEVLRLWNNNLAHQSEIKTNTIIIAKNIARQIGETCFPFEIWRHIFEYVRYSCVPELDAFIKTIFA